MPLKLQYTIQTSLPVEVEGITPDALRDKTGSQIERLEIYHGNQALPLAELFRVSGDAADGRLEFEGNLAGVHWIGAHLTAGEIHVAGNVGRHAGSQLRGGELHIAGSASDWLGAEMQGGLIRVRGSAAQSAGGAYRGSSRGMTGGTIAIDGNAGSEAGHAMRRGLLAVGCDCGEFAGVNMLAGTILVLGRCGARPGAGMRRGTIALLGDTSPPLLPTFRRGVRYRPLMLDLVLRELRRLDFAVPEDLFQVDCWSYHGDQVNTGRGELLVRSG